jgi:predicted RNA-binding Zn ribbon-like protein
MSGETDHNRSAPVSVQPGGRRPAPGQLALVQSFINSHYDLELEHGADLLATPRALKHWLAAHRLIDADAQLGTRELERALAVREGLRSLAGGGDGLSRLNEAASGAAVEVRFLDGAPTFVLQHSGGIAAAIGLLLAITAQAMIEGSWTRLKVCAGEQCGWAFYDHSRNQTGRWCSMSVCGGRAKARAHYRRRRERS